MYAAPDPTLWDRFIQVDRVGINSASDVIVGAVNFPLLMAQSGPSKTFGFEPILIPRLNFAHNYIAMPNADRYQQSTTKLFTAAAMRLARSRSWTT
jgi:hypothetical protein